ncbi:MAG TPA: MarR family transcriptional regulator [Candidatus Dormibacteraeota bacterium]|nr:MarR family transcriptional regulator [Candidatus Dormibacteraeota bacterium]
MDSPSGVVSLAANAPTSTARGARSRDAATSKKRQALADAYLDLMPRMRRRIEARFPDDLREELAVATPYQLEALLAMDAPGGITMNALARTQRISDSSCTALADRLVRQGLAERVSDPSDRRVVRLVPTGLAQRFVERFRAAKRCAALELLAALDDSELETFVALVRKMATAAEQGEV